MSAKHHSKLKVSTMKCRIFEMQPKSQKLRILKSKAKSNDQKIVILKYYFIVKYSNDEVNEEDIQIPKIGIIQYNSFYSNHKDSKSPLSLVQPNEENAGLGCNINLNSQKRK